MIIQKQINGSPFKWQNIIMRGRILYQKDYKNKEGFWNTPKATLQLIKSPYDSIVYFMPPLLC